MAGGPPWIVIVGALIVGALVVLDSMTKGTTVRMRSGAYYAFANGIAFAEGFGVAGAIPTTHNNPGDLKLTEGGSITAFPTVADGWEALYKQLDLIRNGGSAYYVPTMTIGEVAHVWTATQQSAWLSNVLAHMRAEGFDVTENTIIGEVLA